MTPIKLICIYMDALANTHKRLLLFWAVCFLCEFSSHFSELDVIFFLEFVCVPAVPGSSEVSVDHLCDLCDRLHATLAETNMLGRRCKRRSGILRTLFRLIDLNSAQLNLHLAKLCLAVSHL